MTERATDWISPEYATIGGLLLDPSHINEVASWLRPEDFYHASCGQAYAALTRLAAQGATIEPASVVAALRGPTRDRPSALELFRMVEVVPHPDRTAYYGRLVLEAALFRQIEQAGAELVHAGAARRGSVEDLFGVLRQACTPLMATRRRYEQASTALTRESAGPVPIGRALSADNVVVQLEQARAQSR